MKLKIFCCCSLFTSWTYQHPCKNFTVDQCGHLIPSQLCDVNPSSMYLTFMPFGTYTLAYDACKLQYIWLEVTSYGTVLTLVLEPHFLSVCDTWHKLRTKSHF